MIPFPALKYLTSECNYGGRVTDDKDRRLINTLLDDFYCQNVIDDENYTFSPDPIYKTPEADKIEEFIEYIKAFPINTHPSVFGFNSNADITKDLNETNLILQSMLACNAEGGVYLNWFILREKPELRLRRL